jgi:predicted ABC-class ATPase
VNENADAIRAALDDMGLVSFIAEGSILPRREDDLAPMVDAVPFACDGDLMVEVQVPNGEPVKGMGIPKGFTTVSGPSRNGKSSLVDAIFAGIHNHIPGDGREYIITVDSTSFIISEGGRPVNNVDISMFAARSPESEDTSRATASASSSPMSELVTASEAIEMGARLLILDEEYSNPCIIRRGFLAADDDITSLSELGHSMSGEDISMIMVTGDERALRASDRTILVKGFKASSVEMDRVLETRGFHLPAERYPVSKNMNFEKGRKEVSTSAASIRAVEIGEYKVSVPMSGLFDMSQTRALADALVIARELMDGSKSMMQVCTEAIDTLFAEGRSETATLGMYHATVRPMDLAMVINRHPQMLAIQKTS